MTTRAVLRGLVTIARTFGARGGAERALFMARRRCGVMRAEPGTVPTAVHTAPLPPQWPFRPDAAAVRGVTPHDAALERAARVAAGEHHAYRAEWRPLPAAPDEWNVHPLARRPYDATAPWWRVPAFAGGADIKDVWEPGRFAWAYDLMRAWMLTGDERWAQAFWTRFESFIAGAAPFRGPQWMCGQETAIRAIAWLWAESVFIDARASTPRRLAMLREALAWSAERIADAIGYAISQRNNHAISEAVGLVAIGARLHDAEPRAPRWYRRGRKLLEHLVRDQFAADGWYIQHSMTYTRVALDQLVVAERVLNSRGDALAGRAPVRAAIELLAELVDAASGDLPNHGANDGALVLPLATAPYRDFRPCITAAAATFGIALPGDIPRDREALAWLSLSPPSRAPERVTPRVRGGSSGWVHAVSERVRVFTRAPRYHSRPGHLDALHVDVWLDARPVAIDAGTYRYHAPAPWENALTGLEVHNSLTLPGRPVVSKLSRFLWLGWPESELHSTRLDADGTITVAMEHTSWKRSHGIVHRRELELHADTLVVRDDVQGRRDDPAEVELHWLLAADADEIDVESPLAAECSEVVGDPRGADGWWSEHYAVRQPARSLRWRVRMQDGRAPFVTRFQLPRAAAGETAHEHAAAGSMAAGGSR